MRRKLLFFTALSGAGGAMWYFNSKPSKAYISEIYTAEKQLKISKRLLPSRSQHIDALKNNHFDILVIGGGATGTGVALDAVTRGLKTALVEQDDFASGTSSRSTKLIHGGVRYLQKAILGLDREQYKMVEEALSERKNLLEIAPHLAQPLAIMLPVYKWYELPYFYAGIKAYDLVAGRQLLKSSYLMSKSRTLEAFPMLKSDKLIGSIIYYDGQQDDARMCISIALTAAKYGATVLNHTKVVSLIKENLEKKVGDETKKVEVVTGAVVKNVLTGEEFPVKAKCVINAAGPFTDGVRKMDNPSTPSICRPSSGVHIVLPEYFSPKNMGLLDPSTSDGRVIFFIPWLNSTMAGTTDVPCSVTKHPEPTEKEISFILNEVKNYFNSDIQVRRSDVLSAWSGIRPLVSDPSSTNTESIARNHIVDVSPSNLVTVAGGKWTTYRKMAEETVDKCIETVGLKPHNGCETKGLLLEGAHFWSPLLYFRLIQQFQFDEDVAKHLASTYGDKSMELVRMAQKEGSMERLHHKYPFIQAEVVYAVREYAERAVDVLSRRTRLSFLDAQAALDVLPKVIQIMSRELNWSKNRQKEEMELAKNFLNNEMGLKLEQHAKIK